MGLDVGMAGIWFKNWLGVNSQPPLPAKLEIRSVAMSESIELEGLLFSVKITITVNHEITIQNDNLLINNKSMWFKHFPSFIYFDYPKSS